MCSAPAPLARCSLGQRAVIALCDKRVSSQPANGRDRFIARQDQHGMQRVVWNGPAASAPQALSVWRALASLRRTKPPAVPAFTSARGYIPCPALCNSRLFSHAAGWQLAPVGTQHWMSCTSHASRRRNHKSGCSREISRREQLPLPLLLPWHTIDTLTLIPGLLHQMHRALVH